MRRAIALVLLLAGCESYEPQTLDTARDVGSRAPASGEVRVALDALGTHPLRLRAPAAPSGDTLDAEGAWAVAIAFSGPARTAVREVEAALARVTTAETRPRPMLAVSATQPQSDVDLTFDLLEMVGLGARPARVEAAHARRREEIAGLEHVLWTTKHEVRRQLAELALARERARLLEESDLDGLFRARVEGLEARGRLAADARSGFAAKRASLSVALSRARLEVAAAEVALKRTIGLPASREVAFVTSTSSLEEIREERDLLEARPDLRKLRLAHAVAEANLRGEVAKQFPTIELGPKVMVTPPTISPGGALALTFPLWNTQTGPIAEARARREQARIALEDGLVRAEAEVALALARRDEAERRRERGRELVDSASRAARAMHARWLVGRETLEQALAAWQGALDARVALAEAERDLARATADLSEARGAGP